MSLRNAARFFAVSTTIVLSIVGSPVPGHVGHSIATEPIHDLEPQASLTVELKNDPKIPHDANNLKFNYAKDEANSIPLDTDLVKKNANKFTHQTITPTAKAQTLNDSVLELGKTKQISLEITTETITPRNMTRDISQKNGKIINGNNNNDNSYVVNNSGDKKTTRNQQDLSQSINIENKTDTSSTTLESEHSTKILLSENQTNAKNIQLEHKNTSPELVILDTKSTNSQKAEESMELSSSSTRVTIPAKKNYTIIDRKRTTTTSDEINSTDSALNGTNTLPTVSEETTPVTEKTEILVKSESAQSLNSLEDAITSDIPSLEKLKTDLLSSPNFSTKIDTESNTRPVSTDDITKTETTTPIATTYSATFESLSPNTVSSKRAGYLDLSAKYTTIEDLTTLKLNGTESLQGPFDAETPDTQDEISDFKVNKRVESQSQMVEDAIKEELLKEEMLNDNEENAKRQRDEDKQIYTPTVTTEKANATQLNDVLVQHPHTGADDNLSVKPINSDKGKNTILYPVNPNYKPLKKIEVQPAKPFVRDPDDNSWRNESLSSLGIVFKPKNSSKPFTQVLKNKTETEWNNVSEKDRKSEVPDLRVRLEQIAQKRKSKKKKIDSFGNLYYTDYEETSGSSEENTTTPQAEDLFTTTVSTSDAPLTTDQTDITIITPVQTTTLSTPTPSSTLAIVPALTTAPTPKENTRTTQKHLNKMTTLKPPKMFNIFDYYESSDDDDIADYLNMAKIDLKKFTVPLHTTFTPFTSPPMPVLYTNPMTQYTEERKGTIQYFPPRSTKRPRKNKQNFLRNKINSLTLTEPPKNVLPIAYKLTTTPFDEEMHYTHSPDTTDVTRLKEELVQPKSFDRDLYLATPSLTTLPDDSFGVIGASEGYNSGNYVLKQYKEYVNVAGNAADEPKRDYAYTEPPSRVVTMADLIKPKDDKEFDYETQFRKDVLERFVANFNADAKYRSGFPVVYNNSVVHSEAYGDKDAALSRAYFRRPYGGQDYRPGAPPLEPCENATVELSPAYELHYYVPEQEERQPAQPAQPASRPPYMPTRL